MPRLFAGPRRLTLTFPTVFLTLSDEPFRTDQQMNDRMVWVKWRTEIERIARMRATPGRPLCATPPPDHSPMSILSSASLFHWLSLEFFGRMQQWSGSERKAMTTLKEKASATTFNAVSILLLISALSLFTAAQIASAQDLKPIYDGRLSLNPTRLTPSEETLLKEKILPAAAALWHEQESGSVCTPGFEATAFDIAKGSFTRPNSVQSAILYRYCATGHNMALNGIAVVENGKTIAHIVYEGCWDEAVGAMPDLNGDGLSEILLASGGTNQGVTWRSISIIGLSGDAVTKFGKTQVYLDDCGAGQKNCRSEAFKLSVKVGKAPVFFREIFVNRGAPDGAAWVKSGAPGRISLEADDIDYQVIR